MLYHKQLSDFDKNAVSPIDIDMDCLEYLDFFKMTDPNDAPSFDGLYDTIIILGPTGEEKIVYHCGKCIHPVDKSIYDKLCMEKESKIKKGIFDWIFKKVLRNEEPFCVKINFL